MKANKLFFAALAILSIHSISPDSIITYKHSYNRMPANESLINIKPQLIKPVAKKAVATKPAAKTVTKKAVTSIEMKALQEKLANLENELKKKEDLLVQKSKEIENLKVNKTDEKIDALTKLILEQKADVDKLKNDIKNSEVKVVSTEKTRVEVVVCKSEAKGEKLEADVKKLLSDKEDVIKELDNLKKENSDLKLKITSSPEVKTPVAEKEVKAEKLHSQLQKADNSEIIALMSQMTSMFTAQMQNQMQMQTQMMTMFSQMQPSFNSQKNGFDPSAYSAFGMNNYVNAYPSMMDSLNNYYGSQIGIPAQASPWSNYTNPYSMLPNSSTGMNLNRQQIFEPTDYGFSFSNNGFDFNQTPAQNQQLQQPQQLPRQQMRTIGSII